MLAADKVGLDVEVKRRQKRKLYERSLIEHIVASLTEMEHGGYGACEVV